MTREQERAANLFARGLTRAEVAAEVGVSERTLSRWRSNPDFDSVVRRACEAQTAEKPSVRATLEAALVATRPDGSPDFATRVNAARVLATLPPELPEDRDEPRVIVERIYVDRETREEILHERAS